MLPVSSMGYSILYPPEINQKTDEPTYQFDSVHGVEGGFPLIPELLDLIPGVSNRNRQDITVALRCVLLNLAKAAYSPTPGTVFIYGMNTARKERPSRYSKGIAKRKAIQQVLRALESAGLVIEKKGYWNIAEYDRGIETRWFPSDRFKSLVDGHRIEATPLDLDSVELIILKDSNKRPCGYSDTPTTNSMRSLIRAMNYLNLGAEWSCNGLRMGADYLTCKRVFNNGAFEFGGRFYLNMQNVPKASRATITINGQPIIEVDYSSHHPRLLYNLAGLEAPEDCYQIGMPRHVAKHGFMLAINCSSMEMAVNEFVSNSDYPEINKKELARNVLEAIQQAHQPISHMLFKGVGLRLQHTDSAITEKIVGGAVGLGIPILPVHDSYVVAEQNRGWLVDMMQQAYRSVVGDFQVVWK